MSLTDLIRVGSARADEVLAREGEKGVGRLLDELEDQLPLENSGGELSAFRGMALDSLSRLRNRAPELVGLTRGGLVTWTSYLATGDEHNALLTFLALKAPPQSLVSASLDASLDAVAERLQRDQVIADLKRMGSTLLREIGPVAARYLLPLLLQAVAGRDDRK